MASGTLDAALCDFLRACVRARLTLLVSGGTGSGKTTTLGALSSFIPAGERIVTIEDAAELRLRQPHVVRLEARPASLEGRGEVTIRRLVRNALRMRPDRIVVGEVRGGEALDMLSAMASGHDGSLSTVHAGSAEEALRRVETLALMADVALPHAAVRELVAGAIDLVVHQRRERDGRRRIAAVSAGRARPLAGPRDARAVRAARWPCLLARAAAGRAGGAVGGRPSHGRHGRSRRPPDRTPRGRHVSARRLRLPLRRSACSRSWEGLAVAEALARDARARPAARAAAARPRRGP